MDCMHISGGLERRCLFLLLSLKSCYLPTSRMDNNMYNTIRGSIGKGTITKPNTGCDQSKINVRRRRETAALPLRGDGYILIFSYLLFA